MPTLDKEKRKKYNSEYYLKNLCTHGIKKTRCVECDGREMCEHERRKYRCKLCKAQK